jgi:hypothetical protein
VEEYVVIPAEEMLGVAAVTVVQEEVDMPCQEDEGLTSVTEGSVDSPVAGFIVLEVLVEDIACCDVEEERELQPF